MNNEEKAKKIAYENNIFGRFIMDRIEATCLEMAQWKDKQFDDEKKELLGLVNMLPIDDRNQTIIEDLKGLLTI